MQLTREQARAIVEKRDPEYEVLMAQYTGQEKGVFQYSVVVKNIKTGKRYTSFYQSGYKPSIDCYIHPYERDKPVFEELS